MCSKEAQESLQEYLDNKEEEEERVYQMVSKAQEGNKSSIHRKVTRQSGFCEAQTKEAEEETKRKLEEDGKLIKEINHSLIKVQTNAMKSIKEQYREMLNLKIQESERIAQELSPNDPYYEKLKQETEYWRQILEKASVDLESIEYDKSPLQRHPPDGEDQENGRSSREQIPQQQRDQLLLDKMSPADRPGGMKAKKTEAKKPCKKP